MFTAWIPEPTSNFWKHNRKTTYNNWPFNESDKCNAECMAAAGFYVVGDNTEPDLVECFICGKQLNGWEPNDDPWDEHVKHESECPYVKVNKQNETEWTVDEFYDLFKKFKTREYMEELKKSIDTLKNEMVQLISEQFEHTVSEKDKRSTRLL